MTTSPPPPATSRPWLAPLAILLLALLLRLSGLSHDLHAGYIYHPDTSKQIRATERFIQGEYYVKLGARDYDGYPYFNSLLTAWTWQIGATLRTTLLTHLGVPAEPLQPTFLGLFWLTRLVNVLTSTLTVLLVYWIGSRFYHRRAGLIAALLLALSPVDITAAHFATGDSTTSFLAVLSVLFALRIARDGRPRDYLLAGLFAAAAASAKYHGGLAILAALIAHLSRYPRPTAWFRLPSLGRVLLLATSSLIAFVLTSPAFIAHPEGAFKDLLQFLAYTSTFGMSPEMLAMSRLQRFQLGMSLNLPVLLDILGPILLLTIPLALLLRIHRKETWILAIVPLGYILGGLATKPLTHPIYHTLATPFLITLGTLPLAGLLATQKIRWLTRPAGLTLLLVAAAYAANYSARELFFFNHNDTRRIAHTWATDNFPSDLDVVTRTYTFDVTPWQQPGREPRGLGAALASAQPPPDFPGLRHLLTFSLEDQKLIIFRNWDIHLLASDHLFTRPDYTSPVYTPLPASQPNDLLFTHAPSIIGTPNHRTLDRPGCHLLHLVSPQPLDHLLLSLQAGSAPFHLDLLVGGRFHSLKLEPGQHRLLEIPHPRALPITRNQRAFTPLAARVHQGAGRLLIATTPAQQAWLHLNAGNVHRAHALFDRLTQPLGYALSGILSGRFLPEDLCSLHEELLADQNNPAAFLHRYGVHPSLFANLPGITWTGPELQRLARRVPDRVPPHQPDIILEPGRYHLTATLTRPAENLTLLAATPWNQPVAQTPLTFPTTQLTLDIDAPTRLLNWFILGDPEQHHALHTLTLHADPLATADLHLQWLTSLLDPATDPLSHPLHAEWNLLLGHHYATRQQWDNARRHYQAAHLARPQRRDPLQSLHALQPLLTHPLDIPSAPNLITLPANTRFTYRHRLQSVQLQTTNATPGQSIGINFQWHTPRNVPWTPKLPQLAVWIHGIKQGDTQPSFYGDRYLLADLATPSTFPDLPPYLHTITLPHDLPPGAYDLNVGLWLPNQNRTLRVRHSILPSNRRGVIVATLNVQ